MFRSILNLIMIFVIGLSSSGVPIEINRILYIPIEKSISYSFQPAHSEVINPDIINFSIGSTNTNITIKNSPCNNVKVEAYKEGNIIENFIYSELDGGIPARDIIISRDNPFSVYLNISQKTTGLPDGEYIFKFYSKSELLAEINPIELKVHYSSNPQYYKSLNFQPKNSMGITLHFPCPDGKYLIPVTRFVPQNTAVLSETMENLAMGIDPAATLKTNITVPDYTKVYYSGTTVYVVLDSNSKKPADNRDLIMSLDAIVYTMTGIPQMKRVQFLLDGKRVDELAPGVVIKNPWAPDASPAAYLSYNTFDRYLLFPYRPDIKDAVTVREQCFLLFEVLKNGLPEDPMVEPPVPRNVELMNVYFSGDTLKLSFNDAFLKAFEDERHKQYRMMDSVLYTFSSIERVKRIHILINDNDNHSFADYSLSKPLTRPLYLNPETN